MPGRMPANNNIAILEKAIRVLEAFQGQRETALAELATRTRLVESSVFRIVFTLERLGYVQKANGGRYSITSRLSRLAGDYPPRSNLSTLAAPFMAQLLSRFQETINPGVMDGGEDSPGARCIGAPILDLQGHVCAAISISGPALRVKPSRDKEIANALMETCREISALLGYIGRWADKILWGGSLYGFGVTGWPAGSRETVSLLAGFWQG
jgi:DNA-binding IclR family transcriptional regulator